MLNYQCYEKEESKEGWDGFVVTVVFAVFFLLQTYKVLETFLCQPSTLAVLGLPL